VFEEKFKSKDIMKISTINRLKVLFLASLMFMYPALANSKITKCQDSKGKWYYGTNASYYCDDTKEITSLNSAGIKVNKVKGLKTAEQLAVEAQARKEQEDLEKKANFEKVERERIMMIYQTEDDITRTKSKQLTALSQKITQHENYVAALSKQKEIQESKRAKTNNSAVIKKIDDKIIVINKKSESSSKRIIELNQQIIDDRKKYDDELAKFIKYKK